MRHVLPDVPKVGFYDPASGKSPEDIPFPSCLAAVARYLGGDSTYTHLLASSGMAFGFRWKAGWQPDSADQMFSADPNEIISRAFAAAGYAYTMLSRDGNPDGPGAATDEARFRTAIIDSIHRGVPVLAFGVVGPPECCIITGFDDDGATLIGWNFFVHLPPFNADVTFEPNGMFRKQNWFPETHSLVLLGAQHPPAFDLTETLRWAVAVARQPSLWGEATGHAAYEAWVRQLEDDFSDLPEPVLRERHDVHTSQVGILAECRYYAGQFLLKYADLHPALRQAADCFQAEHDLMWKVWDQAGGNGNPDAWTRFARPEVRRAIVPLIREALEQDRRATDLLAHMIRE